MEETTKRTNGTDPDYSPTCDQDPAVADNEAARLYTFDSTEFEIAINLRPLADRDYIVYHRLRRPTLEELLERERLIVSEVIEISAREDRIVVDDEAANWRLWEKIVLSVKGYDFADGQARDTWRELTEEQKRVMLWSHKSTAVRGMYAGDCRVDEADAYRFDVVRLRQDIGYKAEPEFSVYYDMRVPTESERQRFKSQSVSTQYVRGARKSRARLVSNLKSFQSFFDSLAMNIEGATVGGEGFESANRARFLSAIDPIWKRQVVNTLIAGLETQLSDL
jgi:hypothetical protein